MHIIMLNTSFVKRPRCLLSLGSSFAMQDLYKFFLGHGIVVIFLFIMVAIACVGYILIMLDSSAEGFDT